MLLVFLIASMIAVSLYRAAPRVAFEAQRNKEQMLVERGEQYKRGIQLFVRKFKSYPTKMEDLEGSRNIRFLRRRYKDPITGKDEWRLIHVGPGGVFLDSLINKPQKDAKTASAPSSVGDAVQMSAFNTMATSGQQVNQATRLRDSDRRAQQQGPDQPGGAPGVPPDPNLALQPGQQPALTPGQPALTPGQPFNPGNQLPVPGHTPGQIPGLPPGYPGPASNSQTGGQPAYPTNQAVPQPGSPGQLGQQPTAQEMLQRILTQPRPGGAGGFGNAIQGTMGQGIGGGIAGVASTSEAEGIMVYNDHTTYNEWEFNYDYTKDKSSGALPQQQPPPTKTPIIKK